MTSSIINALLEEDKDTCVYIHYTSYDKITRCGAFINCIEGESYIHCQDIITESIVDIDKSFIIRYDKEHEDSTYEYLTQHSPKYLLLLSRYQYLTFYKDLFESSHPIQPHHYHITDEEELNLQCLKISLNIEDRELDIQQHPCIVKALDMYRQEIHNTYYVDIIDECIDLFTTEEFYTAVQQNDHTYIRDLISKIPSASLQDEALFLLKSRTDDNYEQIVNSCKNLRRATNYMRSVIDKLNTDFISTPRSLLTKFPHNSPVYLFSYEHYLSSMSEQFIY